MMMMSYCNLTISHLGAVRHFGFDRKWAHNAPAYQLSAHFKGIRNSRIVLRRELRGSNCIKFRGMQDNHRRLTSFFFQIRCYISKLWRLKRDWARISRPI